MKTKNIIGIATMIAASAAIIFNREKLRDLYCWKFHRHYWGGGNYETCVDCHPHRKIAVPISDLNKLESDVHVPYWVKEGK